MAILRSHWNAGRAQFAIRLPQLGFLLMVGYDQPRCCNAALSISSGYESFLTEIRKRIVCDESDIYDEAIERGRARACDSLVDGPFCRGLPNLPKVPRHRPFTVDSIVPEHLFGDTQRNADSTEDNLAKQATSTLNKFLEEYYNPKVDRSKKALQATEGRLRFEELPPSHVEFPYMFSRGLPEGTVAAFEGMWQAMPSQPIISGQRRSTVLRLNGALGTLRFSRPVVLRHLMVHPPLDNSNTIGKLQIRARKNGKEIWRHEYSFDAQYADALQPICRPGDLVAARYSDGKYFLAIILCADPQMATIRWLGDDVQYRHIPWRSMKDTTGTNCGGGVGGGPGLKKMGAEAGSLWLDMARRIKTVDEISFIVPAGTDGWLLSDVVVAAPRRTSDDAVDDPVNYIVQVFPGLLTAIVETSQAAVVYNADDMLERGLQVRRAAPKDTLVRASGDLVKSVDSVSNTEGESSARLRTSLSHSVEGLRQFILGLFTPPPAGVPATKLPPYVTFQRVVEDVELLTTNLRAPTRSQVKAFGHFEQFFAMHWELLLNIDSLEVAFERWRRDPSVQELGRDVFHVGQIWSGTYHCTQGPTAVMLEIKKVVTTGQTETGRHEDGAKETTHVDKASPVQSSIGTYIEGELSFWVDGGGKSTPPEGTTGRYIVSGSLDLEGRNLALEPVPNSWTQHAPNFVMIGLHGVVTRDPSGQGAHGFAGSVPIFGCDSFELQQEQTSARDQAPTSDDETTTDEASASDQATNTALPKAPGPTTPQEHIDLLKETVDASTLELLKGAINEASAELQQGLTDMVGKAARESKMETNISPKPSGQASEAVAPQSDVVMDHRTRSQNMILNRILRVLEEARARWRAHLHAIVTDKKSTSSSAAGGAKKEIVASAVQQLLKAATRGEAVTLQMEELQGLEEGNTIVLKFGDTEVQLNR